MRIPLTKEIISRLRTLSNSKNVAGMARFGIRTEYALGVPLPQLRKVAKEIGVNHDLAAELWNTGLHEARLVAAFIDDPALVTERQLEEWAVAFDSWDVCDQVCSNLFDRTPFAVRKAKEWSGRKEEFVKRAGFVLMASLSVHDKDASDRLFVSFLSVIKRESKDERNFVRKAVNWALRQIGKRNRNLNKAAVRTARDIRKMDNKTARWIAADALRELTGDKVAQKFDRKKSKLPRRSAY